MTYVALIADDTCIKPHLAVCILVAIQSALETMRRRPKMKLKVNLNNNECKCDALRREYINSRGMVH